MQEVATTSLRTLQKEPKTWSPPKLNFGRLHVLSFFSKSKKILLTWNFNAENQGNQYFLGYQNSHCTLEIFITEVDRLRKIGDGEKRQGNLKKNKHFFGFFHFFLYLPEFLDPKCYTWLESYGYADSYGKRLQISEVTIWPTEFCQHFGIQIITPADTLS